MIQKYIWKEKKTSEGLHFTPWAMVRTVKNHRGYKKIVPVSMSFRQMFEIN